LWLIHGSRSIAGFFSSCSLPSASLIWYIYMWYIYITWYYHDIYMCVCVSFKRGGHSFYLPEVIIHYWHLLFPLRKKRARS
jgi:hypothetical protein